MNSARFRHCLRFERPAITYGLVALLLPVALALLDWPRTLAGLKLAGLFTLFLALGSGAVIAIGLVTGARWMQVVYRPARCLIRGMPLSAGFVLFLVALTQWTQAPGTLPEGSFAAFWMSPSLLIGRTALVLVLWTWQLHGLSRRLGSAGPRRKATQRREQPEMTGKAVRFLLTLGLTWWLACLDWWMPTGQVWISSGFWVYALAGLLLGAVAALTILLLRSGPGEKNALAGRGLESGFHDLGKLLFALACFWAYLWFSQLLLIWYAHLPAETGYLIARANGDWKGLFYSNLLLNWAVPALVLLPRRTKFHEVSLLYAAVVVLIGRWTDLLLMLLPDDFGFAPWFGSISLIASACWGVLFALLHRRWAREALL